MIDAIVAAVERGDDQNALRTMVEKLKPWLLAICAEGAIKVETVTMPRDAFLDRLNDKNLLEHVTLKPWEEITDDMRVRHAHRVLQKWADEGDDYLAIHEVKAHSGRSAVVAFMCSSSESLEILQMLGAWRNADSFWDHHLRRNIDTEFPPSEEEILRLWDHRKP